MVITPHRPRKQQNEGLKIEGGSAYMKKSTAIEDVFFKVILG